MPEIELVPMLVIKTASVVAKARRVDLDAGNIVFKAKELVVYRCLSTLPDKRFNEDFRIDVIVPLFRQPPCGSPVEPDITFLLCANQILRSVDEDIAI